MTAVTQERVPALVAGDARVVEFRVIPLTDIYESPWNPRRHFDPAKLEQLAANLKTAGQLTPMIVRPAPADRTKPWGLRTSGAYEIGAGHRRFRALKLAGIGNALCRVVVMDDAVFTELLNIENLQRDDIHPLEEAQGFRDLMERAGYDVAKIAARVGRSEKYVYDRIKLLQLIPEAKQLFLDGAFEAGHAILLARLSPTDQVRAIGKPARGSYDDGGGGLFEFEDVDGHPDQPRLKLEDKQKPRSVRELAKWIDDHVRFKPETLDPFLFPKTAELIAEAKEADLKVVHITHDYRVPDGARDEKQRTYGENSWKRAKNSSCEYVAIGVVVGGPGRGEAFPVCVRKDKCKVHWAKEQKDLERDRKARARYATSSTASSRDTSYDSARYEAERKARDAECARWKAAMPRLYAALAEKLKATPVTPTSPIGKELRQAAAGWVSKEGSQHCQPGRTIDDLVRYFVFASIDDQAFGSYDAEREIPRALKAWGIDARKIVDEVSPKVQPAKSPAKPAKKGTAK